MPKIPGPILKWCDIEIDVLVEKKMLSKCYFNLSLIYTPISDFCFDYLFNIINCNPVVCYFQDVFKLRFFIFLKAVFSKSRNFRLHLSLSYF